MSPLVFRTAAVASLTVHPLSHQLFGQLPSDEFADLQADIQARGIQYPPEVDVHGRIICGSQRFRAAQALGWTHLDVLDRLDLTTEDQIREHLVRDNLLRRHLTRLQRFRAAQALVEIETHKARERQKVLGRSHGQDPSVAPGDKGRTDERVARSVGWAKDTYRRMETIVASGDEVLIAQVDREEISIKAAARLVAPPRHRAPKLATDDPRAPALKLARWQHEVARFLGFMETHPPAFYHPLEANICAGLEEVEGRLRNLRGQVEVPRY